VINEIEQEKAQTMSSGKIKLFNNLDSNQKPQTLQEQATPIFTEESRRELKP